MILHNALQIVVLILEPMETLLQMHQIIHVAIVTLQSQIAFHVQIQQYVKS